MGISDRWDSVHFQSALPFLCISMALLFVEKFKGEWVKNYISVYFIFAVLSITTFLNVSFSKDVWFFDKETQNVANRIKQYTEPGEEIFLFGPVPLLYYFSDTLPAGKVLNFQLP